VLVIITPALSQRPVEGQAILLGGMLPLLPSSLLVENAPRHRLPQPLNDRLTTYVLAALELFEREGSRMILPKMEGSTQDLEDHFVGRPREPSLGQMGEKRVM
jgi:hypothetical protein